MTVVVLPDGELLLSQTAFFLLNICALLVFGKRHKNTKKLPIIQH